ncbi:grpE protein homolog, mitochondrial isoform X1 [Ceratitis capitata]|uniref:grpE protein homolog, mitochondrial isoform X1 n=1 Tax=Ceratitis capitata TaxID=7213 RepID=UPI00032976BD|nr:grpE protein homolog, mitochondrial isoform X1 [Ceratitis capitata]
MSRKTVSLFGLTNRYVAALKSRNVLGASTPALRFYSSENSAQKPQQSSDSDGTNQLENAVAEATKKLSEELEVLTKEVNEIKEKNDELLDKYKRSLADSENLRTRLTKQIADAKVFGIQSFCKDLLEVADILGHATEAVPKEELNDNNPHLKNLYEGLVMTKASLLQVFKRHGLEPINPLNEKFNPNMHEALFEKDDPNVEPSTIVVVTKLGYKLHERCIRPALVGVSKS